LNPAHWSWSFRKNTPSTAAQAASGEEAKPIRHESICCSIEDAAGLRAADEA
jgi:hypothetical protein